MAKRLFDIIFSLAGLVVLGPLMVVIAVLVKLDSTGPVFYRGVRSGQHGRLFRILKFRTMRPDAEKVGGPTTAKRDPRITRIGTVLRRTKLDEIPQVLNVLAGQMSLVGPRPEVPECTALYVGEEKLILNVRPGVTDFASIEFLHLDDLVGDETPYEVYMQRVWPVKNALRIRYVKEQSLLLDVKLICATFTRLFSSGRGIR